MCIFIYVEDNNTKINKIAVELLFILMVYLVTSLKHVTVITGKARACHFLKCRSAVQKMTWRRKKLSIAHSKLRRGAVEICLQTE